MSLVSTNKEHNPANGDIPEWFLQYRIAWDGMAYSREEFRNYYGSQHFRVYWNEALDAKVEGGRGDRHRKKKMAAALRWHTRFDEAIIENITSFVTDPCFGDEPDNKYEGCETHTKR